MKKIFLFLLLLISFNSFGQLINKSTTYGEAFKRGGYDLLMWLPNDTLTPPTAYIDSPFVARKNGAIYLWNTSTHKWEAGAGGTVTSVGTGYGLSGGTITGSGTLLADTATLFRAVRTKRVNDIDGSHTLNYQTTPRTITGVTVSSDSLYSGTGSIYASGDYRNTASNEWEQEIIFSPTSTISGTIAINVTTNQSFHTMSCVGSINLATSTISITNGGSTWTQTSSVTAVSANDVIRMRIIFYHNTLKFLYENITKNEVVRLDKTLAFGYLSGAGLGFRSHNSGTPGITFTSVTSVKVFDWKFKDNTRGQVAWVGQSIGEGYAATSWASTYVAKIDSASYWKVALYAKAGMSVRDLVVNGTIDNLLLTNPSVIILDGLWYNDGLDQTLANTWTRITLLRKRIAAHNIPVIWLGPSISQAFATSINDSIQTHYPNDLFYNLNSFLSGSWASADGVHPNDVGHQQLADSLMIRLPFVVGHVNTGGLTGYALNLNGKTSGNVTVKGAAAAGTPTLTLPTITGTIVQYVNGTTASSATPTPTGDAKENNYSVTALAEAATFGAPSGTPSAFNTLLIRIKDNSTVRALSWNAIYRASTDLALPTTTVDDKTMYVYFVYNSTDSKWDLVGLTQGF